MQKVEVYLLTGSNLGDREGALKSAENHIREDIGEIKAISKIYETEAWGKTDQPSFYNQVLLIDTTLSPIEILNRINTIEEKMGRKRMEKWAERIIDIDILYYQDEIVVTKDLKIPHPEIQNRRFTLIPLSEIAQDFRHPVLNVSNKRLLEMCADQLNVRPIGR
ncbi:MAG: 2-amino-4-hydroxy-6-hydroxymethyldihydropteridine diphosphokinase [Cytophagaceae bacterium]